MHTVHLELHLSISFVRLCSLPIGTVHGCVGRTLSVMNRSQFEEIVLYQIAKRRRTGCASSLCRVEACCSAGQIALPACRLGIPTM